MLLRGHGWTLQYIEEGRAEQQPDVAAGQRAIPDRLPHNVEFNGAQVNGAQVNDVQVNGAPINGAQVNGAPINGAQIGDDGTIDGPSSLTTEGDSSTQGSENAVAGVDRDTDASTLTSRTDGNEILINNNARVDEEAQINALPNEGEVRIAEDDSNTRKRPRPE
jgi:hypothetical protein